MDEKMQNIPQIVFKYYENMNELINSGIKTRVFKYRDKRNGALIAVKFNIV